VGMYAAILSGFRLLEAICMTAGFALLSDCDDLSTFSATDFAHRVCTHTLSPSNPDIQSSGTPTAEMEKNQKSLHIRASRRSDTQASTSSLSETCLV
jgi:hypothetical protein